MGMKRSRLSAERVVTTSLLVDISDILLNLASAFLSGSVIMLSQTLRGAADLLTVILLWIGVKRSKRKPDKTYHFGYGRELYFWILMSGVSMFVLTAGLSVYLGFERFLNPRPVENLGLSAAVLAAGFLTNGYALSLSLRRMGLLKKNPREVATEINHSTLIETKTTLIVDSMGTVASLLGLAALWVYRLTGDLRVDGVGAILVGLVCGGFVLGLVLEVKEAIAGRSASAETEAQIREAAEGVEEVVKVLDLKTMRLGPEAVLVNMEVHLQDELTTRQIEKVMDVLKRRVKRSVTDISYIQVEVETPRRRHGD